LISELTTQFSVSEIVDQGQRRHIAFTPVNSPEVLLDDPQLDSRGFFVDVDHGSRGVLRHAPVSVK
jgi:crotonobetainyl-CoA:carnitine CoA-transferase CaiB-like acyl-CoA transferase